MGDGQKTDYSEALTRATAAHEHGPLTAQEVLGVDDEDWVQRVLLTGLGMTLGALFAAGLDPQLIANQLFLMGAAYQVELAAVRAERAGELQAGGGE